MEKSGPLGRKKYPDFAVCEYAADPVMGGEKDRVLLVLEIGSSPERKQSSSAADADLERARYAVQDQLERYMNMLGDDGERWRNNVLGVAALGLEVAFLRPQNDGWEWYTEEADGATQSWFSLYGHQFQTFIDEVRDY